MSNNHPLGITVASLREMLDGKDDTLVIDEMLAMPNPDPTGPDGSARLIVTGARDLDTPPEPMVGNDPPLRLEVGLLRTMLEPFPGDTIVNAIEPGPVPGSFTLKGRDERLRGSGANVFTAPAGTPFPMSNEELHDPAGPWSIVGHTDEPVPTLDQFAIAEELAAPRPFDRINASLELKLDNPEEFRDFIDSLVDDQLDRTLAAADKAEDGMDLDRLAAELRLMLPEANDLEMPAGTIYQGIPEHDGGDPGVEYSAEAIVAWFRQELAIARRRAYRTGYALGRHAGEHQEPTA